MKPSRRASTRRRRKSLSASPQVGTPAAPSTPFSPVPRDAPRPPCPSGFDPDVWERVVDIAVAASAKDAGSGRLHATPGWATHAAAMAQETRRWDDVVHPETDASDATPAILRATSDAHEKKHAESLLVAARAAVAAAADSEAVDPAPLVRFALLREDLTARESATDGERAAGRGVAFAADVDTRTGSGDSKTESEKLATNARDDRKSSLMSLPERDAALRALATVRDEHAAEVTRLCASQENYEAFTAAVARLGGVRELLRRTASQARAQHDELVAAGAPVLAAEADCSYERATAARAARAARRADACRGACAVAREAEIALAQRRWFDALAKTDAVVNEHVPRLAPAPKPRSRFARSGTATEPIETHRKHATNAHASWSDDERDSSDDGSGTRECAASRALAASLLEDSARARDAALRGADATANQWLVAARAAAAAAGARALSLGDRRGDDRAEATAARETAAFSFGDPSEARALVRASVERARARGAAAASAARRAAVDVAAAAERAKAARRAGGGGGRRPFVRRLRGLRGLGRTLVSRFRDAPRDARFDSAAAHRLHRGGGGGGPRRRRGTERTPERGAVSPTRRAGGFGAFLAPRSRRRLVRPFRSVPRLGRRRRLFFGGAGDGAPARRDARVRGGRARRAVRRARPRAEGAAAPRGDAVRRVRVWRRREKKTSDDALRRLINESLAKFVGHFVIERRVARDRALDVFDGDRTLTEPSHLERAFVSATRELEAFVVAAVADAGQAAVARAAVAAVERACFALARLGPGFEAAPLRLRDAAARAARARVLELLEDDTADACATSATSARARLARLNVEAGASAAPADGDVPSAFAADLASAAEAFAAETGAFLGGLARVGDARGGDVREPRDAAATARSATRACVERVARTCALPLFSETEASAFGSLSVQKRAFSENEDEALAARLIADAAWLDARVDGWCALAAAAARRAFRATETTFPARDEELARRDSSSVDAKAPELASTEGMEQKSNVSLMSVSPPPFAATARACERALLRAARAHIASAAAAAASPNEWAPASAPSGPSERASAVSAYFYGTLRRALATPAPPAAVAAFARVARASLALCADATLRAMETDLSSAKTVNAHGLLGLRHDLEAFEHVAETLAETLAETAPGRGAEGGSSADPMRASLASLRVLLRLCAEPAAESAGAESRDPRAALEAFVAETFAGIDDAAAANDDDALGAAPLTRARAARILEKYRDVPAGKGTGHAVSAARSSGSFANKRRIDAVVKALKACG
jgi:hypothetical protein